MVPSGRVSSCEELLVTRPHGDSIIYLLFLVYRLMWDSLPMQTGSGNNIIFLNLFITLNNINKYFLIDFLKDSLVF